MNYVYTTTIGERDDLRSGHTVGDEEWIAFSDRLQDCSPWKIRDGFCGFKHPCPNSRNHKTLTHLWLPDASYSLWIDANMTLQTPLHDLIERYLKYADLAMFAHPVRGSIYEEQKHCEGTIYAGLPMKEQIENYQNHYKGLWCCGLILRRHTKSVERFNECWWAEQSRWGWMDQLSCPTAINKSEVRIHTIPGDIRSTEILTLYPHKSINHLRAE